MVFCEWNFAKVSSRNRWFNAKPGLKKVTPHTQSFLGHSSPKTMQIYTPVAVNSFRRIKNPLDLKYLHNGYKCTGTFIPLFHAIIKGKKKMAFPKKGLRKITVDGVKYGYNVTGNDGWISFSIGLIDKNGEILTGVFSYNEHTVTNFKRNGKIRSWSVYPRIKITPNTIRQVIEYGLKNGWNPQKNKGQIRLGNMDDKIELNLNEETKFPDLEPDQVALNFAKLKTGHVLNLSMELYLGEGEIYHVFNSLKEAINFAKEKINEDSEIESWIMAEKNKAIKYITSVEEKEFE